MINYKNNIWVEKHRPKTVDDYIFSNATDKNSLLEMIKNQTIPHLLFHGIRGTGKTSLALLLIDAIGVDTEVDVLKINASNKRGIDTFRDDIQSFALTMPMGKFKVIRLEEADEMTPITQKALKDFMEENCETVRFILTCNNVNRLIPELRSRCQEFEFKDIDTVDITLRLANILVEEKVSFTVEMLDKFVSTYYPDIRKMLNELQRHTIDNQLVPLVATRTILGGEYCDVLVTMIENNQVTQLREYLSETISSSEWESVYRFLYENLHTITKFKDTQKWQDGIVTIADHLYKHTICSDSEINFAALIINLGRI